MRTLLPLALLALSGCGSREPQVNAVVRDAAEHEALVEAMKQHPSLQDGQTAAAAGAPLRLAKLVEPRPAGVTAAHHHHAEPDPRQPRTGAAADVR